VGRIEIHFFLWKKFWTRVTRIFHKSAFTKTVPVSPSFKPAPVELGRSRARAPQKGFEAVGVPARVQITIYSNTRGTAVQAGRVKH
jgi:hypothetical protein